MKKLVLLTGSVLGVVLPIYLMKKKAAGNQSASGISSLRNQHVRDTLTAELTDEEADMVAEGALTTVRYENKQQELE